MLSIIELLLRVYLYGIPKEDCHIKDIMWLIKRHRGGYDKYKLSLSDYRTLMEIDEDNMKDVELRLERYNKDSEGKHLIDACFYLLHECSERRS